MFEVKDIMCRDVFTVGPETTLYETMNILVDKKISGLPVVDNEQRLLGIISEKDVMVMLIRRNIGEMEMVKDYMTKKVISFAPSDSAVDVADFFMQNPIRRVPIVENGKLVGIVARRDIVSLILKIRGKMKK